MVSLKLPKPVVRIFSKPSIRIDYHHVNVLNNYSKQLYLILSSPIPPICSVNTQQWKLQHYKSAPGLLPHYHTHC